MTEHQDVPPKLIVVDSAFKEKSGAADSVSKEKSGLGSADSVFKEKSGLAVVEGFPKLRRRRCRSLSKAETIVTEEEKIRRAQPDKP